MVAAQVPGKRLAIHTTAFPAAIPFLGEWHRSVRAQSDRTFDLWVSLDGLTSGQVEAACDTRVDACWVAVTPGTTPASIRQEAIEQMSDMYDAVMTVDCDDVLRPSRVSAARARLFGGGEGANDDLIACALDVMDENSQRLGITFAPPSGVDAVAILPRYNVFGLSNSVFRMSLLRRCLPIPPLCVAYDWLLASRAYALGARLSFDDTARVGYRQYSRNTARVLPPFDAETVRLATARVMEHHRYMLDEGWPVPPPFRAELEEARQRVTRFAAAIADSALLERYLAALNRLTPWFVWWWSVAHPELEDVWNR